MNLCSNITSFKLLIREYMIKTFEISFHPNANIASHLIMIILGWLKEIQCLTYELSKKIMIILVTSIISSKLLQKIILHWLISLLKISMSHIGCTTKHIITKLITCYICLILIPLLIFQSNSMSYSFFITHSAKEYMIKILSN